MLTYFVSLDTCTSNIYYINDHLDKRTWTYIFGACCSLTVFIPSFHNYRIWSFLGLGMTTYTAWYMTIAALVNGQVGVHSTVLLFMYFISMHICMHVDANILVLLACSLVNAFINMCFLYACAYTRIDICCTSE